MWSLYLDESGDLGFDFGDKNPSNRLTIAILATRHEGVAKEITWAVKKTLKRKVCKRKKLRYELKGVSTGIGVKRHFYEQVQHLDFGIYAVTLDKHRIDNRDPGRLYNFLARRVLDQIPFEEADGAVTLFIDRSKGRHERVSFDQSIRDQLEGRLPPECRLAIHHHDSCANLALSAADLFCWGIFRQRERNDSQWYDVYRKKVLFNAEYP